MTVLKQNNENYRAVNRKVSRLFLCENLSMESIISSLIEVGYEQHEAERMYERAARSGKVQSLAEYISIKQRVSDGRDFDDCFMLSY